jgi:LEA14-like dessication related protein
MKLQPVYPFFITAFIISCNCLVLITACHQPQSFEYRGMQNLKIDSVGLAKSKISLELVYFNPNNFGVSLRNVNCDVYINHNYLGKYVLDTLMHIAKKSEFAIPSSMDVDMKNIYKNSLNTLLSKQVLVELRGSSRVGKSGIFISVPFNYSAMETFSLF